MYNKFPILIIGKYIFIMRITDIPLGICVAAHEHKIWNVDI